MISHASSPHGKPRARGHIRPDVVWFAEILPDIEREAANDAASRRDDHPGEPESDDYG